MDVREKLVEICFHEFCMVAGDSPCGCDGCPYGKYGSENNECFETYKKQKLEELEKAGVTVQEWSSANEPPEENGYYLCYVLTSAVGDKVKYEQMPLYWEDDIWLYRHNSYRMCRNVTHWMPLPQPPKGE